MSSKQAAPERDTPATPATDPAGTVDVEDIAQVAMHTSDLDAFTAWLRSRGRILREVPETDRTSAAPWFVVLPAPPS